MSGLNAEIVEFLVETRLFAGWSAEELEKISGLMTIRPLEPREVLFAEGEPGDALFVLLEGRLAVFRGECEVGDILEGDHLGEGALVHSGPRRVTVRGADPASLAVFTGDAFVRLSESEPTVHAKLLRVLLRETTGKMRELEGFLDTP